MVGAGGMGAGGMGAGGMARASVPQASVPIPKFANPRGTSDANFGIKETLANYDSSAVLDLKFLSGLGGYIIGTSNPPH
jgi:hypothetical protein